ncbi:hypothetical protein IDVR_02620 [Intrasporangium sp. DVR]
MALTTDRVLATLLVPEDLCSVDGSVLGIAAPAVLHLPVELDDDALDEQVDPGHEPARLVPDDDLALVREPEVLAHQPRARLTDRLGPPVHPQHGRVRPAAALVRRQAGDLDQELLHGDESPVQGGVTGDHGTVPAHRHRAAHDRSSHAHDWHAPDLLGDETARGMQREAASVRHLVDRTHEVDAVHRAVPQREAVERQRGVMAEAVSRTGPRHRSGRQQKSLLSSRLRPDRPRHVGLASDPDQLPTSDRTPQLVVADTERLGLGGGEGAVL